MKKIALVIALTAALVLSCLTVAAPASAESGVAHFHRGGVPPTIDLVRMRATNGESRIRVALHVRDLRRRGTFVVAFEDTRARFSFYITMWQRRSGIRTEFLWSRPEDDEESTWSCPRARIAWLAELDRIVVTFPQSCFPVRVPRRWGFRTGAYDSFGDDLHLELDYPDRVLVLDRG